MVRSVFRAFIGLSVATSLIVGMAGVAVFAALVIILAFLAVL